MSISLAWGRYDAIAGTRPITWLPPVVVPEQHFEPVTYDRHVRRSGDDYIPTFVDYLPMGPAWPSWDAESIYMKFVEGSAQIWGEVDGRADDLLVRESDPRATMELLRDWERNFGLPDDCVAEPLTFGDRQRFLVHRMTMEGGQSRQFFLDVADYYKIKISVIEHSPFMVGVSRIGDTTGYTDSGKPRWEIGRTNLRFYWTIGVGKPRLTWFRVGGGGGQVGVDHHLEIGILTDIQCLFERLKPAHVELCWELHLETLSHMEGTP